MSALTVISIVEGAGEETALPRLLSRLGPWLGIGEVVSLPPIRQKRDRLIREKFEDLNRAARLARLKLGDRRGLVLLLIDAEKDCGGPEGSLGPRLRARLQEAIGTGGCVVANRMFETWFVAGLVPDHPVLQLNPDDAVPDDPEAMSVGKGWIKRRMPGQSYRETADQKKLVSYMDLKQARERSRSFDKLCRVLEEAAW